MLNGLVGSDARLIARVEITDNRYWQGCHGRSVAPTYQVPNLSDGGHEARRSAQQRDVAVHCRVLGRTLTNPLIQCLAELNCLDYSVKTLARLLMTVIAIEFQRQ